MPRSRAALPNRLGMVRKAADAAWNDGLAMARAFHAVHGHLVPPKTAAINGHPIGQWLCDQRRTKDGQTARTLPARSISNRVGGSMSTARSTAVSTASCAPPALASHAPVSTSVMPQGAPKQAISVRMRGMARAV
jgi:hypothetical protein